MNGMEVCTHQKAYLDSHQLVPVAGEDTNSLVDSDKALNSIYEACVAAGPSLCAIYENTTERIAARINKLINDVRLAPVPFVNDTDPSSLTFGVVDYGVLIDQLSLVTYLPYSHAPFVAEALVQLERGSGSAIFQGSNTQSVDALSTCSFNASQPFVAGLLDVELAITCGDQLVLSVLTLEESRARYQELLKQSPLFAPAFYDLYHGGCP